MRPLNEYSKKELKEMLDSGIIGKCSLCGKLEPIERKWPYHNVIICKACKERKEYERTKRGLR
jgi:hypothetical protein